MKARIAILACISATVCFPGAQFAGGQEALDYSFPSNPCDTQPDSAPVFDGNGNLFGTCTNGTSDGLVYELSSKVGGAWTEQAIYTFGLGSSTATGSSPNGVIFDAKMVNLYGTTSDGGAYGSGVVFELSPKVGDGWTQAVLYSFGANGSNDGSTPMGSLVFDTSGNLYGTTSGGGANFDSGAVFELSPESGGFGLRRSCTAFPLSIMSEAVRRTV